MTQDFNAPMRYEQLSYSLARLTTADAAEILSNVHGAEVLVRTDGAYVAVFNDIWALRRVEKNHPEVSLTVIGTESPNSRGY